MISVVYLDEKLFDYGEIELRKMKPAEVIQKFVGLIIDVKRAQSMNKKEEDNEQFNTANAMLNGREKLVSIKDTDGGMSLVDLEGIISVRKIDQYNYILVVRDSKDRTMVFETEITMETSVFVIKQMKIRGLCI